MGLKKNVKQMPDQQPEEWEKFLKDVTVEPNYHEVLYCPEMMNTFPDPAVSPLAQADPTETDLKEQNQRLNQVKVIIQKKLTGKIRKCMEIFINSNAGTLEIAKRLGISDDTVRRNLQKGIQIIKACLEENHKFGQFPIPKGKRPPLRISLFPLDTPEERSDFQNFVNQYPVTFISYRGDALFREALVVYRTGKSLKRNPAELAIS